MVHLLVLTCGVALADSTVKSSTAPAAKVAPADSYFGRLKMSILGIQNVIKDMRLRIEADPSKTPTIFGALATVEDAMHEWESQYPHDVWIAKDLLALEITYLEAPDQRAHALAVRIEAWLRHDFGKSQYASQGHAVLQKATLAATQAAAPAPTPSAGTQETSEASSH